MKVDLSEVLYELEQCFQINDSNRDNFKPMYQRLTCIAERSPKYKNKYTVYTVEIMGFKTVSAKNKKDAINQVRRMADLSDGIDIRDFDYTVID